MFYFAPSACTIFKAALLACDVGGALCCRTLSSFKSPDLSKFTRQNTVVDQHGHASKEDKCSSFCLTVEILGFSACPKSHKSANAKQSIYLAYKRL